MCCVVLAAGEGKRMNTNIPKVLADVLFKPMVGWVLESVFESNIKDICVVKGFKHEMVQKYIDSLDIKCESVIQNERKGTAHAVIMAKEFLEKRRGGDVLILGGDSPFIDKETILNSYKQHKNEGNSSTIISSKVNSPFGYGRIIRNFANDTVTAIVEERDANDNQKAIQEINSGAYWFRIDDLLSKLFEISDNTSQKEFYLTSIIELLIDGGFKVSAFETANSDVVLGANDLIQLEKLNKIARNKILDKLVAEGVNIPCRDGVIVGRDTVIYKGTTVLPNTMIIGRSVVYSDAIIGPNSQIVDSKIGEGVIFNSSYCKNSCVLGDKPINPFTYLNNDNFICSS